MFTIEFTGNAQGHAETDQETSLLHAANRAGVDLAHRCGGHARCGTCKVSIESGHEHLSEPGTAEKRILGILKAEPGQRLACQCWAKGDVKAKV